MKLYRSRQWLHKRYILEGKTIAEMSKEAGVNEMTIRRALEKEGLK